MNESILRPVWRAFAPQQLSLAALHAHAGGIAVVQNRTWYLLGNAGSTPMGLPLMTDWAIRAIEAKTWKKINTGDVQGLVQAPITKSWRARVMEWVQRDQQYSTPTVQQNFDCTTCAACCFDNHVLLDGEDKLRFQNANRIDLLKNTQRTRLGRVLPLVASTKACVHLSSDLRCTIYLLRPNLCREFPPGTEHCLTAREEKYGRVF